MSDDLVAEEQPSVDRTYALAEAQMGRLQGARTNGIVAGDGKAADNIAGSYAGRFEQLRGAIEDERLLVLGRVDLDDGDDRETVYIARCRVDGSDDHTVASWEAPVAGALYDPERFELAQVELLRRFVGDGRDRVLRRVEQPIPARAGHQTGSGPVGDSVLERLRESSTGEMRDVVETIQAEQYRLMELPPDSTVVIQGGPGTGKTVVGLHRISLLLYRNAETLSEGDVLVVGPNDVFIDYIRDVLPSLGRGSVRTSSLAGLAGVRTAVHDTGLTAEVKGRRALEDVIASYLSQRISAPDDLRTSDGVDVPHASVEDLVAEARASDQPYNTRRQRLRRRLHDLVDALGSSISMESSDFENVLNRVMPDRAPRRVVADLLTGRRLLAAAADGILSPTEQAALLRDETPLEATVWTVEDAALLDEAAHQLDGVAAAGGTYTHVVADEAQNLSPLQIRMLHRRLADGAGMTILGDLAQATSPWAPRYWDDHFAEGGIVVDDVVELSLSYRVPKPVLDYANRLLDVIDVSTAPPRAVVTDGPEPTAHRFDSEDLHDGLVDHLKALDLRDADRVGIILRPDEVDATSEALEIAGISHALANRSLDQPVTLVTFDDVGGLEFDHVVVLNPGRTYRSNGLTGARELYVALSRSRRSLALLHSDDLPPVYVDRSAPVEELEVREPKSPSPTVDETAHDLETAHTEEQPRSRDFPPPPPPTRQPAAAPAMSAPESTSSDAPVEVVGEQDGNDVPTHWVGIVDNRIIVIDVEDEGAVVITSTAATGGPAAVLARGAMVRGAGAIAWALRLVDGQPFATTTSDEPGAAVAALGATLE